MQRSYIAQFTDIKPGDRFVLNDGRKKKKGTIGSLHIDRNGMVRVRAFNKSTVGFEPLIDLKKVIRN